MSEEKFVQGDVRSFDFAGLARENVAEMLPYIPGKPILEVQEEYGLGKVIKLSSNECPFGLPPGLGEAVAKAAVGSNRYPDAMCRRLRAKVAKKLGVGEENLIFSNGAEEGIRLIAQIFLNHGDAAVIPTPIFDAYSVATRLMGAREICLPLKASRIDLASILLACEQNTDVKLVWLCSPSNPTGDILKKQELDNFLACLPQNIMVVLDEAYAEFVTNVHSDSHPGIGNQVHTLQLCFTNESGVFSCCKDFRIAIPVGCDLHKIEGEIAYPPARTPILHHGRELLFI